MSHLKNSRQYSEIINKLPVQSETHLQQQCVIYFKHKFPKLEKYFFAIPNGGSRNIIEAMRLKREGVVPGVADLFLAIPSRDRKMCGMFIEMKTIKGGQSDEQIKFQEQITKYYHYEVIRTLDEFITLINNYLK